MATLEVRRDEDFEEKHLLEDDSMPTQRITTASTGFLTSPRLFLMSVGLNLLLLVTVVIIVSSPFATVQPGESSENLSDEREAMKFTSSSSPLFDKVDLSLHWEQLNGRIQDNTSIFRLDPSEEVDSAWTRLTAKGNEIITVDRSSVSKSGKNPDLCVKAPLSWDRGPDAYIAQVDVFHQIHCLNELRKEIHFDYYYGMDARLNGTSKPRDHVDHKNHCIHMLLQNLMCHADVEIITHNWVHYDLKNQPTRPFAEPLADFNLVKKCRNFDALLGWTEDNAVQDLGHRWHDLKMPQDAQFVQGDGYF